MVLQSHDEQDDDEHESEEQDEGTDKMSVSMLASSSAAFWQRMLRLRWDRLQAEEAEALLEQEIPPLEGGEDDASGEKSTHEFATLLRTAMFDLGSVLTATTYRVQRRSRVCQILMALNGELGRSQTAAL